MAKGTVIFLFLISLLATLLLGINIGKNIGKNQSANPQPTITPSLTPTVFLSPTILASPSATVTAKIVGISTYSDKTCGFSFSYPGSYLRQKTTNEQSIVFTDPDDPNSAIATTCSQTMPRPPVASDKIEAISIEGVAANLYHDQYPNGSPRDEVIVKNPNNNMEIIVVGYGDIFQKVLASFKFID